MAFITRQNMRELLLPGLTGLSVVRSETSLSTVRDTLWPGLWASEPDFEFDMQIDFVSDNLLVRGLYKPSRRIGEFEISRKSIIDETYKTEFAPKLRKLVQELKGENAPLPELPVDPVFGRKLDL